MVLAPDSAAMVFAFSRDAESVEDGRDDHEKPREDGQDFVSQDRLLAMDFSLGERIV